MTDDIKYINEVVYNGSTLISLVDDDVTTADVLEGITFHTPDGATVQGAMPAVDVPDPEMSFDSTTKKVSASGSWENAGYTTNTSYSNSYTVTLDNAKAVTGTTSLAQGNGSLTLTAGAGSVSTTSSNVSLTTASTEPSSGYYIKSVGSGTVSGKGSGTVTVGTGYITSGSKTSKEATDSKASNNATKYYTLPSGSVTPSGGVLSIASNYENTPTVTISDGSDKNISNWNLGAKDTTNYPYYFKIASASSALSGTTKVIMTDVKKTQAEGYIPSITTATTIISGDSKEPTVTVKAGSGNTYLNLKTGTTTIAGGGLSTGTASGGELSGGGLTAGSGSCVLNSSKTANVTTSDTDNGIKITFTGSGSVERAAVTRAKFSQKVDRAVVTKTATAGYIPAIDTATTVIDVDSKTVELAEDSTTIPKASKSSNDKDTTKFITGITVPKATGFSISTTANTETDSSALSVTNGAYRNVVLSNSGIATVTNNSTANITNNSTTAITQGGSTSSHTGTVTVNAWDKASSGTLSGNQTIVSAGNWVTNSPTTTTSNTTYYGKTVHLKTTTSNIAAANIKHGVVVKVGDSGSATRVANVTGSFYNDGSTYTLSSVGTEIDMGEQSSNRYITTSGLQVIPTALYTASKAVTAADITAYGTLTIGSATPKFDGGAPSIKESSSSASGTNITISDTDTDPGTGVKIVTSGSATPKRAAVLYNGAVSGWVSVADNTTASAEATGSATTITGNTYYVTAVSVPKDKVFSISTVADTALDTTSTLTVTNNAYRQVAVTNNANGDVNISGAGRTDFTVGSTTTGTLYASGYIDNGTSTLSGSKAVITNGKWTYQSKTPSTSAQGPFYGETRIAAIPNQAAGGAKYATTSAQTLVTAPKYITSNITLGALSQTNLSAANIKSGTTITINNGSANVWSVTGTANTYDTVSSVPSTKSTDIIYNTGDSSYYLWVD